MIHMSNVCKTYDTGAVALDHVNVDIEKGEFVFIVGASGAGKSTFIKMLLREVLPTSGKLLVDGHDIVGMAREEIPYLRRGLGVIFQDYRLLPDKTVFENVAFAMQVIEAPRRIMQRSATWAWTPHPPNRRIVHLNDARHRLAAYHAQPFLPHGRPRL